MYGDTQVMRKHAAALREQGSDVRLLADQLVARTESIGWVGRAADAMRERVRDRASHLRATAARHDSAAATLERHVAEVDRLQETIVATERKTARLVDEATARLEAVDATNRGASDSVRVEPDADDVLLTHFSAPPPGHRDWLTVELPGL